VGTAQDSITTIATKNYLSSGSIASQQNNSQTSRLVSLMYVPASITINQLSYNVAAVTTAGTYKICVYSEDGATKLLDVTSGTNTVNRNDVAVSPAVTLAPGHYYVVFGCAATCSNTVTSLSNVAIAHINGVAVPATKRVYTGTVTHSSGVCDSSLGTVTAISTATPLIRFDN
jgi:hypothetical protein